MIVSPKIGCPYIIKKTHITIYWASKRLAQVNNVSLIDNGTELALSILSVKRIKWSQVKELKSYIRYNSEQKFLYRIKAELPAVLKENKIFDLKVQNHIEYNSVYNPKFGKNLKIAHITDTHVAKRWDELQEAIVSKMNVGNKRLNSILRDTKSFLENYINPNNSFRSFIKQANKLHREGDLDIIMLTGDIVDYAYEDDGFNNFQFFIDLILGNAHSDKLQVPVFTVIGNHDHRSKCYRFQAYGLKHVGISRVMDDIILQELEMYKRFPIALKDFRSMFIRRWGAKSPVGSYYSMINPYRNYSFDLNGKNRVIGIYSGIDAFLNIRLLLMRPFNILGAMLHVNTPVTGFDKSEVHFLEHSLSHSRNNIVLIHAPLVNFKRNNNEFNKQIQLPGADISEGAFYGFLNKYHLNNLIAIKNRFQIFKAMINTTAPVISLHGHIHMMFSYQIEKESLIMEYKNWDKIDNISDYYIHTGAPALGHIHDYESYENSHGFRYLSLGDDFAETEVIYLDNPNKKFFVKSKRDKSMHTLSINLDFENSGNNQIFLISDKINTFKRVKIQVDKCKIGEQIIGFQNNPIMVLRTDEKNAHITITSRKHHRPYKIFVAVMDGDKYKFYPKTLKV